MAVARPIPPELWRPLPRAQEGEDAVSAAPSLSYWQDAWLRLRRHRGALWGLSVILLMVLGAILGPMVSGYRYDQTDLYAHYSPPSAEHWFGTDQLGRDVFTRVMYGARISLAVGVLASVVSMAVGVVYGAVSGFLGGAVDQVMMAIVDVLYGIPYLLVVIGLMVLLGPGLHNVLIALVLVFWLTPARIVRAEVLSLKEREFVLAARTLGVPTWSVILRHLLPNTVGPLIVTASYLVPDAIFTEAILSYLGLGVSAPMASWGVLAAEGYKAIRVAPWVLLFPVGAIAVTMLAFNFLGDGLRDALDPRMRR